MSMSHFIISRTVTISNRSDIIVQFKWSNFATLREEHQQKDRLVFTGQYMYLITYMYIRTLDAVVWEGQMGKYLA